MSDITPTTEELFHYLAHRFYEVKAVMAKASGEDPWESWSPREIYSVRQMSAGRDPLDETALRAALGVVTREIDLFDISMQNVIGYLYRASSLTPLTSTFDLSAVVSEVFSRFENMASERGICLSMEVEREREDFHGDPGLIRRALVNVIDNAVKYSLSSISQAPQKHVRCVIQRYSTHGQTLLQIWSYGLGILPDEIHHVFKYGWRGRLVRDRHRLGIGIGLSETKRIVEAHGGHAELKSVQQHDDVYLTTVSLIFPAI